MTSTVLRRPCGTAWRRPGHAGAQHEVALTLGVVAQLPDGVWTGIEVDPLSDSEAALARLGVVWTPDLLGADISHGVV